ncbi:MAG TPA: hypothetical protein GX725_04310 [Mollicutes bacterium]|nr:hypothetical protein [Mollicutes bacterium]
MLKTCQDEVCKSLQGFARLRTYKDATIFESCGSGKKYKQCCGK